MGKLDPNIQKPDDMSPEYWAAFRAEVTKYANVGEQAGSVATGNVVTVAIPEAPVPDKLMVEGSYGDERGAARYAFA